MGLVSGLPDIRDTNDLLSLLTLEDESDKRKELEERILGKDLAILPVLKKFKSILMGNISVYQNQSKLVAVRLNLLIEKTALVASV